MTDIITRLRNIAILTIAFFLLLATALTTEVQADPLAKAATLPCAGSHAPLQRQQAVTLVAADGAIPLHHTPDSQIVRLEVPIGTPAALVDGAPMADGCWLLVELTGQAGQGWLPSQLVAPH